MVMLSVYLKLFVDGICVILKDRLVYFSPQVILVLQSDPQLQGFIDKLWGVHGCGVLLEAVGREVQSLIQDHQLMEFWGISYLLLKPQQGIMFRNL